MIIDFCWWCLGISSVGGGVQNLKERSWLFMLFNHAEGVDFHENGTLQYGSRNWVNVLLVLIIRRPFCMPNFQLLKVFVKDCKVGPYQLQVRFFHSTSRGEVTPAI